ncbi:outer membrane efflux protein [unidentified eubacterium SCB49]|nr:outer membrane efflux protein [unidentified eubacterium SCB49]
MKKFLLLGVFTFTMFTISAQTKKWTLQDCVVYALENNISVKQSELDVANTALEKSDAVGNFLPSINANANVSKNTGLGVNPTTNQLENRVFLSASGGVNLGYTLFDGLRNIRQVQRAEISQLASQYRLDKMKDDIALFVANSYLQVLLNKANLEVILTQNTVTKEQIKRTEELVEAGSLPRGDLLEIQASDASELQQIAVAENAVQISLISLAQLLLIKDYANFDIADDDYNIINEDIANTPIDTLIESAKENRQEINIAESDVSLAEKDVQLAKGALLPTLNAFFGYDTRYSDADITKTFNEQLYLNDGIGYGLSLNIPILNGFSARNNVSRSKINLERSQLQLEQAQLDLESNVYQAMVDVRGSKKAYEAAQTAFASQELAYQYAKDRYEVGLTNAFDFSQSKVRYDNANIEINRTKYDYIFKLKVLELYFGVDPTQLKF